MLHPTGEDGPPCRAAASSKNPGHGRLDSVLPLRLQIGLEGIGPPFNREIRWTPLQNRKGIWNFSLDGDQIVREPDLYVIHDFALGQIGEAPARQVAAILPPCCKLHRAKSGVSLLLDSDEFSHAPCGACEGVQRQPLFRPRRRFESSVDRSIHRSTSSFIRS